MATYNTDDWIVTEEGLYIATRDFLIRRGYCCASRCRNCPYINWREDPTWKPIPAEHVRRMRVAPRSLAAARFLLKQHEAALARDPETNIKYHQRMVAHYRGLLEHWQER
ncbi:DUF5522 domain-containing protein [Ktedonobacter robiniae]|uniref:Uncharacterized protein n=1 Tax=Ktedonobacter robiniae TaxID=2778365 RepID=A0ABQ3UIU9_9CHLR|nr:DUF5522 domain-containing protein [Ktedonobacter robiniae]GHO52661.1 hypothetical protein KSB_11360 [Ktedonobacter robiniae]